MVLLLMGGADLGLQCQHLVLRDLQLGRAGSQGGTRGTVTRDHGWKAIVKGRRVIEGFQARYVMPPASSDQVILEGVTLTLGDNTHTH